MALLGCCRRALRRDPGQEKPNAGNHRPAENAGGSAHRRYSRHCRGFLSDLVDYLNGLKEITLSSYPSPKFFETAPFTTSILKRSAARSSQEGVEIAAAEITTY